jgi:hypothetical protein
VHADRVELVVPGDPLVGLEISEQVEPRVRAGWFSATKGLSEIRISSSYRAMICGQSVASALGASSWIAAIAAWSWYGPIAPRGSASVMSATPSAM